ncbi:MAG: tRNA pseudouridine(38-40) synthase TruA [Cyclobacteriaceae bacterium]
MRYFLYLSYNGTHYHGWQIQNNAITVQQVLNEAMSTILRDNISTMGSGRTDTGVHAAMQVVHFDYKEIPDSDNFLKRMNGILPKDIAVDKLVKVQHEANTRFDAVSRQYHYKIHCRKNPFLEHLSYGYFHRLDVDLMNKACDLLLNWKDFECFSRVKTEVNNFNCDIFEAKWFMENDMLLFSVRANRFLRGMVRAIVGTMLELGENKIDPGQFREILESRDRRKAGRAVPPQGLYLNDIVYPQNIFIQ